MASALKNARREGFVIRRCQPMELKSRPDHLSLIKEFASRELRKFRKFRLPYELSFWLAALEPVRLGRVGYVLSVASGMMDTVIDMVTGPLLFRYCGVAVNLSISPIGTCRSTPNLKIPSPGSLEIYSTAPPPSTVEPFLQDQEFRSRFPHPSRPGSIHDRTSCRTYEGMPQISRVISA